MMNLKKTTLHVSSFLVHHSSFCFDRFRVLVQREYTVASSRVDPFPERDLLECSRHRATRESDLFRARAHPRPSRPGCSRPLLIRRPLEKWPRSCSPRSFHEVEKKRGYFFARV